MLTTANMNIHDLVSPFTSGVYVDDWEYRASALSTFSDMGILHMQENPFLEAKDYLTKSGFLSNSPVKKIIADNINKVAPSTSIAYSKETKLLTGVEYDFFNKVYGRVDSSEKVVMSACAHALHNLHCPPEIQTTLCNHLYEEALHLKSISTLLGIDQSKKRWISEDKENHWSLISSTKSITEYIFLECCIYEGRGCIAAAKGVYELGRSGTSSISYDIAYSIFEQETNHVLAGYFWLKQLDDNNLESTISSIITRFFQSSDMDDINTFKGKRQRFSLFLLFNYLTNRNYWEIKKIIIENTKSVINSGNILVTNEQLVNATKFCFKLAK